MDGNPHQSSSSLMELLKKYTERVNERETLVKETPPAKAQSNPPGKSPQLPSKSSASNQSSDHYKTKWEESESKYRLLERKYHQLENQTVKHLQEKIVTLERDSAQLKMIKERIAEIGLCRQLTSEQFEQLKYLVSNDQSLPIETIANKNDFLQQTRKLREILLKHNEEFLDRLDQVLKKKRKRTDDDLSNEDGNDDDPDQ